MEALNQTGVTEFVLLAFPSFPDKHTLIHVLLTLILDVALVENVALIIIIILEAKLHIPMYFFLCTLAILESCYTLTIVPRMLLNLMVKRNTISYNGCITQMFFFVAFGNTEICVVTIMAYDRYIAVCNPLLYKTIINDRVVSKLLVASFTIGFLLSLFQVYLVFRLHYCGPIAINHFFCDVEQVILLASTCDELFHIHHTILIVCAILMFTIPFLLVVISYIVIILEILKISSALGRWKSFSSCSSHLMLVSVQYSSLSFMYLRPASSLALDKDKVFVVIYTFGTLIMIPIIYSLRNQVVKSAFRNRLRKIFFLKGRPDAT